MSTENGDFKFIAAMALILGGVAVFGWQVYAYLRHNIWTPVSVIVALQWMEIRWAINPSDWFGLYNILVKMPLSLTMMVMGWMVVMSG
jgi:hypothetical protein